MHGFAEAGLFRIHTIGPLGLTFNYADARPHAGVAPQMFWLAKKFARPVYAWSERRITDNRPTIFHVIWGARIGDWLKGNPNDAPSLDTYLPLDAFFHGVNVATFRSDWDDSNAFYLAFKGGNNKADHSHLDLGTFVFDALGERWALDLGPDNYNLPAYFGSFRFSYYRLRTKGHNTLTNGGENQNSDAKAPIVGFLSTPDRAFAVGDLTEAYAPKARKVRRGVALLHRNEVLVEDEIEAGSPIDLIWNFHTRANVELDGSRAVLSLGGKQIEARILSPEGAHFEVIAADPPPPQAQQPDIRNLVIRLPATKQVSIAVALAPPGRFQTSEIEPLDAWVTAAHAH
jgi:hypothetical protein